MNRQGDSYVLVPPKTLIVVLYKDMVEQDAIVKSPYTYLTTLAKLPVQERRSRIWPI